MAMSVFGAPHPLLNSWTSQPHDDVAPFLRGLTTADIREDQMIVHDSLVAPAGWNFVLENQVGVIEFRRPGEKLTVMNFNRTTLETTLGVDLMYYHHKYRSMVMVQYKRMIGQPYEYRPDGSHELELQRMTSSAGASVAPRSGSTPTADDYRLYSGAFYWKLCPKTTFTPVSTDLIRGMYLPLDFWATLVDTGQIRGPWGGICARYDNVGRYINNTLFIRLVQDGWIGSRLQDTDSLTHVLDTVLSESMESGKSLVVAISEQASDNRTDNTRSGRGDLED